MLTYKQRAQRQGLVLHFTHPSAWAAHLAGACLRLSCHYCQDHRYPRIPRYREVKTMAQRRSVMSAGSGALFGALAAVLSDRAK